MYIILRLCLGQAVRWASFSLQILLLSSLSILTGFVVAKVTMEWDFVHISSGLTLLIIVSQLLHTWYQPVPEVCDGPVQAAPYYILGPYIVLKVFHLKVTHCSDICILCQAHIACTAILQLFYEVQIEFRVKYRQRRNVTCSFKVVWNFIEIHEVLSDMGEVYGQTVVPHCAHWFTDNSITETNSRSRCVWMQISLHQIAT